MMIRWLLARLFPPQVFDLQRIMRRPPPTPGYRYTQPGDPERHKLAATKRKRKRKR